MRIAMVAMLPQPLTIDQCQAILRAARCSVGDIRRRDGAGEWVWAATAVRGTLAIHGHDADQSEAWRKLVQLATSKDS